MGIGLKIKEYRNRAGLTQKDLADELHVTYQAVSRWENDDAEPSFDMLKDICRILNCTADDLFEMDNDELEETIHQPEEPATIKEVEKPVIGICNQCNKPIYDKEDMVVINKKYTEGTGKNRIVNNIQITLCKECNEVNDLQEKRIEDQRKRLVNMSLKKRRIHSFIWPSLMAIALLVMAIISFTKGNTSTGVAEIIFGILVYTFLGTMILNNTFLTDMWLEVASWGAVRMPGIIFSLSFDGLIFLIAAKILFFILGIMLGILAVLFSTFLALGLSLFVYPFALRKNMKGKE